MGIRASLSERIRLNRTSSMSGSRRTVVRSRVVRLLPAMIGERTQTLHATLVHNIQSDVSDLVEVCRFGRVR